MANEKLWGGRFTGESDPAFAAFNRSFAFDARLFEVDVQASLAYSAALQKAGIISATDASAIKSGLEKINASAKSSEDYFADPSVEDVHTFVEARLVELIGDTGRKLHTGRSRNDQVATDLRLWMRQAIDELTVRLSETQTALLDFAETNRQTVVPGYTHLQRAQPVLLAHWCLAYFEMLARDRERIADVRRRVNVLPLGSAALAGTSFPIDRETLARELGFDEVSKNSLDAVSDRDFCVEFLSACSLVMIHLSRLAEDIIIYSTSEFGFFELGDAIATGSSLMPQKKNPDSMELVRGKAGRVVGNLQAMLTTLKGLPLAYNKDMQEDKEAVFEAFDTVGACLRVSSTVLKNISVNGDRAGAAAATGYMNATELADYLVRKGVPFREAHAVVGKVVMRAIELGKELEQLEVMELKTFSPVFDNDVYESLTIEQTLRSKSVTGGTSPDAVDRAMSEARERVL
ncbi:MAG TPA: argininosuccinate lyase [Pyrinomonadaceae bacterium]